MRLTILRSHMLQLQILVVVLAIAVQIVLTSTEVQADTNKLAAEVQVVILVYLLSIIVYSYVYSYQESKSAKLQRQRNVWIRAIVERTLAKQQIRSQFIQRYLLELTNTTDADAVRRELGLQTNPERVPALPPDLVLAEQEIVQAEDRSTVLIATSIFFPIIFAIAHLFRSVYFFTLVLEALVMLLIVESIVLYYQQTVKITGWSDSLTFLESIEDNIISVGTQSLVKLTGLLEYPHSSELGKPSKILALDPARVAVATCAMVTSKLPRQYRRDVLHAFVQLTHELPQKEELLAVKFQALKSRVMLVTTIGIATAGLFAGIAKFSVPAIDAGIMGIQSTQYLPLILFGLAISTSYIIASQWTATLRVWVVIWTVEYWVLYLTINLFIF